MTRVRKLAMISDVHADVDALRAALVQIDRLGCDAVLCAGDLVGYGEAPEATLALLRERGFTCVRGNHDRWALAAERDDDPDLTLSAGSLDFLRSLPSHWNKTISGVRVAVWHARPGSDMDGIEPDLLDHAEAIRVLDAANADVLIVGHTHRAFVLRLLDGRLIASPGPLLRELPGPSPKIFDPNRGTFVVGEQHGGGTFGVLELPSRRFAVRSAADGEEVEVVVRTLGVVDHRQRD